MAVGMWQKSPSQDLRAVYVEGIDRYVEAPTGRGNSTPVAWPASLSVVTMAPVRGQPFAERSADARQHANHEREPDAFVSTRWQQRSTVQERLWVGDAIASRGEDSGGKGAQIARVKSRSRC